MTAANGIVVSNWKGIVAPLGRTDRSPARGSSQIASSSRAGAVRSLNSARIASVSTRGPMIMHPLLGGYDEPEILR